MPLTQPTTHLHVECKAKNGKAFWHTLQPSLAPTQRELPIPDGRHTFETGVHTFVVWDGVCVYVCVYL